MGKGAGKGKGKKKGKDKVAVIPGGLTAEEEALIKKLRGDK